MSDRHPSRPLSMGSAIPRHPSAVIGNSKTFVFVDPDSRRHKRVKVVRACEGCRRRKIKCNAATSNTWPCDACSRLRLNCVPPKMPFENASHSAAAVIAAASASSLQTTFALVKPRNGSEAIAMSSSPDQQAQQLINRTIPFLTPLSIPSDPHSQQQQTQPSFPLSGLVQELSAYSDEEFMYHSLTNPPDTLTFDTPLGNPGDNPFGYFPLANTSSHHAPPDTTSTSGQIQNVFGVVEETESESEYEEYPNGEDNETANYADPFNYNDDGAGDQAPEITRAMGDLKIQFDAVAPYIKFQSRETTAPGCASIPEPVISNALDDQSKIQIPPEMMPSEQRAQEYFNYFFANIHPYVPVLNSSKFYQQWQNDRASISPFVLDGIFACASSIMDGSREGSKWLALADRHEEACKNSSSLSTIQGMILCLKAQESSPKPGYFYRSWMTLVSIIAMAKDLELNQHHELHQAGHSCDDPSECGVKYRVWHVLFILEPMVGGPQGRSFLDFGVHLDTVDFEIPTTTSLPEFNEYEIQISRQFTTFMKVIRNIVKTGQIHHTLRKKNDAWSLDQTFLAHDADFPTWIEDVPSDLRVDLPEDGSTPSVPSVFMAIITCYHHLSLILHVRPQIDHLLARNDPAWKDRFASCYDAAQKICKIQEAILENYGVKILANMQRGYSFSIYTVLSCIMLHLAAVSSPDLTINKDAREFLVRHMRILEQCAPICPIPEMQAKINSLRTALSEDPSQPFELKRSLRATRKQPAKAKVSFKRISQNQSTRVAKVKSLTDLPSARNHAVMTSFGRSSRIPNNRFPPPSMIKTRGPQDGQLRSAPKHSRPTSNPDQFSGLDVGPNWSPAPIFRHWNAAFGARPMPTSAHSITPQDAISPASRTGDSSNSSFDTSSPASDDPSTGDQMAHSIDQSMLLQQQQPGMAQQMVSPTGLYLSVHGMMSGAYQQQQQVPDQIHPIQETGQMASQLVVQQQLNQSFQLQQGQFQNHLPQSPHHQVHQQQQIPAGFTSMTSSGDLTSLNQASHLHPDTTTPQAMTEQYLPQPPAMWQDIVEPSFIPKDDDVWCPPYDDPFLLENVNFPVLKDPSASLDP